MKKAFLLFFIIIYFNIYSQPVNKQNIKYLTALGKVWGFLKYFHPEVAQGKYNWDTVIIMNFGRVTHANSKKEFNNVINGILGSIGDVSACKSCLTKFPSEVYKRTDISWIHDTTVFNKTISDKLQFIYDNYKSVNQYYIYRNKNIGNPVFTNEKVYDVSLPSKEFRFLALCRFWNVVNYFYPYLYKVPFHWDSLYTEFIPRMSNISTDYFYFRTIQEMASRLEDGHAFVTSGLANMFANRRLLPFKIKSIDNRSIICDYLDSVICKKNGIQIGDIVVGIEGFNLDVLRKHHARYIASSNKNYLTNKVDFWMSAVKTNPAEVKIFKGTDTLTIYITTLSTPFRTNLKSEEQGSYYLMNDSVGYIHLGKLKYEEISEMFKFLKSTKYIIVDCRYYPNWTVYGLADKFLKEQTIIAQITEPDYEYPGNIKWVKPMYAGKTNKDLYKGALILLINDETMSQGEITVMALMKAPKNITIGTQTAGACGDVSSLPVPGGITINFTGLGYYFSDYSELQNNGIIPQIVVETTFEGIKAGKDEILERALQYIVDGERYRNPDARF